MKRTLPLIGTTMVVLLVTMLALQPQYGPVSAQTGGNEPQRTINVSGTGQASAVPDIAVVTLGVQTEAEQASAALSQNNERMQAVINAVKEAGVAQEDIQTQAIQLQPRLEQPRPQEVTPPNVVGYVATNTIQVTVRKLDNLGQMLDAAVQAGSNLIENISFQVSDPAELLDRAREAAWQDAQHKAEQLAKLAGAKLGDVLTINESSSTPIPVVVERAAAPAAAVPIQPGTQMIEVDIQVTWALSS
jgi:uncharacterized protein YggE